MRGPQRSVRRLPPMRSIWCSRCIRACGVKPSFDFRNGIDEWRLICDAEGRRDKERRGPLQPETAPVQAPERFRDRVMRRSPWTVAIASQSDEYHLFLERNWTGV